MFLTVLLYPSRFSRTGYPCAPLRPLLSPYLLFSSAERDAFDKKLLAADVQYNERQHCHERGRAQEVIIAGAGQIRDQPLQRNLQRPHRFARVIEVQQCAGVVVVAGDKAENELRDERGLAERNDDGEKDLPKAHAVDLRRLDHFAVDAVDVRPQKEDRAGACEQAGDDQRQHRKAALRPTDILIEHVADKAERAERYEHQRHREQKQHIFKRYVPLRVAVRHQKRLQQLRRKRNERYPHGVEKAA